MTLTVRERAAEAGHKVAETAKTVGHKIVEGAKKATDWVKEKAHEVVNRAKEDAHKTEHTAQECCGGTACSTDISAHKPVIASCGKRVGTVDRVEGDSIKLAKKDSPDGGHHLIPKSWVARVDEHVHLNKNSEEVEKGWKSEATGCCA